MYAALGGAIAAPKPYNSGQFNGHASPGPGSKYLYIKGASAWKEISLPASTNLSVWTNPYSYARPLKTSTTAGATTTATDWGGQPALSDGVDYGFSGSPADWMTPNPLMLFNDADDIKANNYQNMPSVDIRPQIVQFLGGILEIELAVPYNGMCTMARLSAASAGLAQAGLNGNVHYAVRDSISPATLAQTYGTPTSHIGSTPSACIKSTLPLEHDQRWFYAGELDTTDAPAAGTISTSNGFFPRNHVPEMARGFYYFSNSSASAVTVRCRMRGTFAVVPNADDSTSQRNPLLNYMLRSMPSVGGPTQLPPYDRSYRPSIPVGSAEFFAETHAAALEREGINPNLAKAAAQHTHNEPDLGHSTSPHGFSEHAKQDLNDVGAAAGTYQGAKMLAKASGNARAAGAFEQLEEFGSGLVGKAWGAVRNLGAAAAETGEVVGESALALL
jgi:hypothetical protein